MGETTQLMLTVECSAEAEAYLGAVLEQCAAACAIVVPLGWQPRLNPPTDSEDLLPPLDSAICQRLLQIIQSKDVAALIANDPEAAKAAGADGCHFDANEDLFTTFETARRFLGTNANIGTIPGATRHQAMTLAESGTDYMGYPVSDDDQDEGTRLMAWWAEIFETPVVAFTDGSVVACERALTAGPPDFLAVPLASMTSTGQVAQITALIDQHGQLPTA